MKSIARVRSDFPEKFGIPRQSGRVEELVSTLVFEEPYRNPDAVRGLEEFSHIWLLWEFSENLREGWSPTVRPPKLGGNRRVGVFATRSPFRPNPIGLSCVRLLEIKTDTLEGPVLLLGGADLMDNTPVYDIKPYLPGDCRPEAAAGFTKDVEDTPLRVEIPGPLTEKIPANKRRAVERILAEDPRPGYQNDPQREYGLVFAGMNLRFRVEEGKAILLDVQDVRKQ